MMQEEELSDINLISTGNSSRKKTTRLSSIGSSEFKSLYYLFCRSKTVKNRDGKPLSLYLAGNYQLPILHISIIQPNMVLVTLSFLFSASSSDTIQSMRYANSLESLDAVSTSIQQARAQSSQLHHQIEAAHNGVRYFMNSHFELFSNIVLAHNQLFIMKYSKRTYINDFKRLENKVLLKKVIKKCQ